MKTLDDAVNEVTAALFPLPEGFYVAGQPETGAVLVCCKDPDLGFLITKEQIDRGLHHDISTEVFADLVKACDAARKEKRDAEGPSA